VVNVNVNENELRLGFSNTTRNPVHEVHRNKHTHVEEGAVGQSKCVGQTTTKAEGEGRVLEKKQQEIKRKGDNTNVWMKTQGPVTHRTTGATHKARTATWERERTPSPRQSQVRD
jgi:hypothetical protein